MNQWISTAGLILRVLGVLLALASIGYATWGSSPGRERWIERLGNPRVEAGLYLAGLSFSLGMAAAARSRLESILWLLLALTFVVQLVILRQSR